MSGTGLIKGPVRVVAAAPAEARAVAAAFGAAAPEADWVTVPLAEGWSLVRSGVGKVNAGACVASLREEWIGVRPYGTVLNVGVCGALPVRGGPVLEMGSVVVGSASVYADEGVAMPEGFKDMGAMGFEPWPGASREGCARIHADVRIVRDVEARLRAEMGGGVATGLIATVSTCSGTDALAAEIAARTGAVAEAMEGAAIGHVLTRLGAGGPAFLEIRVVSNTTGDRVRQVWDLKGALGRLTRVMAALAAPTA